MSQHNRLRSHLSRARGLGSAHEGTHHWVWQRLTALAILPLSMWFIISMISMVRLPDPIDLANWMSYPFNAILSVFLFLALFHHARLGLQVVIEDYVHKPCIKIAALVLIKGIFIFATIASIASVAKLHYYI
ncbi:MAG: succinate dehydrogenase, hydrophobic membrane anchor protein [Alphaproteobacteria bacterium]|nr:MAG: succinate dehydrogenase, hydrophobic membrane anchor protein [Alphaproteobacteria bacterium]TAF77468.1 MAG: succinate dehydrogenase, hydrophobic membrane anchor protein [Alphaproteobacteria bacterium]